MSSSLLEQAALAVAAEEPGRVKDLYAGAAPSSDGERLEWALLLVEVGELEIARVLTGSLTEPQACAVMAQVLCDEAVPPPSEADDADDEEDALEARAASSSAPDRSVVVAFLRWFGGRTDLYARQWFDGRRRRGGYRPVREPFTEEAARAHLAGRHTLGQYLLWPDATVSFAVIDLDLSSSASAELEAGHGGGSSLRHPALRAYVKRLMDAAEQLGIPVFPADSGRRGAHIWVFFEPRRPARAARALLGSIVDTAGAPPTDVSVEIFPKQDRHGRRGLSSLVKLPLGVHRASLRACPLLTRELDPLEDLHQALSMLRAADPIRVDAVLSRRLVSLPLHCGSKSEAATVLPRHGSARSLAAALRDVPDGREAREAAERMVSGCSVLRALVDRAYRREALSADEGRALIYSLGLVGRTPALATEALAAGGVAMRELHRVRRGLQSPVGCGRLRRLPRVGTECTGCPNVDGAKPYATPAHFAVGSVAPAPPRHAPFADWLRTDALPPDPVEALADAVEELHDRLRRVETADTADEGSPEEA